MSEHGNIAGMREALKRVLAAYKSGAIHTCAECYRDEWDDELGDLKAAVEAALATPPRNCDRYHTVEEAFAACHEDRGYLSDPVAERRSTISFMLSVAQKEPKFEQCDGESASTEGDRHGI